MKRIKKRLFNVLLFLCSALLFAGCGNSSGNHKHKWSEITCKEPKTCTICGITEGEPSPRHQWIKATCTEPSICSVCGKTKDAPLGHVEGEWITETTPSLAEDGEDVLRCIYCKEILDSETTEKYIEASEHGFNFDSSELFAYLEKGNLCDLSEVKSYTAKDVVLETCSVPDNEAGISEVDVITKNRNLISVLFIMHSDEEENFEKVLAYLEDKMPEGTVKEQEGSLCENEEVLSWSSDPSVSLETQFTDSSFYIALSCKEGNLTQALNTADAILRIPLFINVEFQSNLFFDKYGVEIALEEESICSLEHGENFSKLFTVPQGEYTLDFTGTDEDKTSASKTFQVTGPTTVNCKIQTHADEIEFHKYELLNNVDSASIALPDVNGLLLSEAKELLRGCGFKNISVDSDDWILDDDDYRVLKQKPKAGKNCEYKAEIILSCVPVSQEEATLIGSAPGDVPEEEEVVDSEYEMAFVKEGSSYDIYYMFDADTQTVINFISNDSYIMEGTYSGALDDEISMDWVDDGYSESFTVYDDGTADLIDANGWDWEYKQCSISKAETALRAIKD